MTKPSVLVVGDGITGRLLIAVLTDRGFPTQLLMSLRKGETARSQGILHTGLKYHRLAITEPERFQRILTHCARGCRDWETVIKQYNLRKAIRSATVRYVVGNTNRWFNSSVLTAAFPELLHVRSEDYNVFEHPEYVLDVAKVLRKLRIKNRVMALPTFEPRLHAANITSVSGYTADRYVFACGGWQHPELPLSMTYKPLKTLEIRGNQLPKTFQHLFPKDTLDNGPEVTITSPGKGRWQVGGDMMVQLQDMSHEDTVYNARRALEAVMSEADFNNCIWETATVNRVALTADHTADGPRIMHGPNYMRVFPGKLTYVATLVNRIIEELENDN